MIEIIAPCRDCNGETTVKRSQIDPRECDGLYCAFCGSHVPWSCTNLGNSDLVAIYGSDGPNLIDVV